MTDLSALVERLRDDAENVTMLLELGDTAALEREAASELERLAKELKDAKRERGSYYMDYRLKCDAESKAANVRAEQAESALAQMREERDRLKDGHCKDCCCARIWKALGVESYTGLSIWEHVEKMREERDAARQAAQTHWDERQKETRELEAEIDRLRAALGESRAIIARLNAALGSTICRLIDEGTLAGRAQAADQIMSLHDRAKTAEAERDHWHQRATDEAFKKAEVMAERDAALARQRELDHNYVHAKAEAKRLLAALERVEWVETNTYAGRRCPWCSQREVYGHAPNCSRQMALGLTGGNQ